MLYTKARHEDYVCAHQSTCSKFRGRAHSTKSHALPCYYFFQRDSAFQVYQFECGIIPSSGRTICKSPFRITMVFTSSHTYTGVVAIFSLSTIGVNQCFHSLLLYPTRLVHSSLSASQTAFIKSDEKICYRSRSKSTPR